MISNTIANALTASTSSQRQDSCSSSSGATDEPGDSASFSSAMANAKAASPASDASTPQAGDASTETAADSGQSETSANGQTATDTPSPREITAGTNSASKTATTSRPALVSGSCSVPASAPNLPNGLALSSRAPAADADGSTNSQAGAKRVAGKATSSAESIKPSTAPTTDTGVTVCGNSSATPDASVGALALQAAAQTIRADLSAHSPSDRSAVLAGAVTDTAAYRAANGVDAAGTAAVASAQGEDQALPVPGLITSANASVTGTVPSFAMLFARSETAAGGSASGNTQDAIADTVLAGGTLAGSSPMAALATLAGTPSYSAPLGLALGEVNIATRVGDPGFGQDVSRQLVFLAKTGAQSAELSLQPPELGPVSVSIQMNGLQASLAISASHAATRTALQEALPHLSELFQSSGLQLADAHVGDGSARNPDQSPSPRHALAVNDPLGSTAAARETVIGVDTAAGGRIASSRLIDTFA